MRLPLLIAVLSVPPLLLSLAATAGNCRLDTRHSTPTRTVTHVIDGDTLELSGGIRIRMLGINTPELGRDGKADQPYARAARRALYRLLKSAGFQVRLVYGTQKEDRYRRWLAHVFTRDGRNLQQQLLLRGLAFNLPFPPNLRYQDCYRQAEHHARHARRRLWRSAAGKPVAESSLTRYSRTGYRLVRGTVSRVYFGRRSVWINFTHRRLSVRIARQDLKYFRGKDLGRLRGRTIVVRGYMTPSYSRRYPNYFYMRLRHRDSLID